MYSTVYFLVEFLDVNKILQHNTKTLRNENKFEGGILLSSYLFHLYNSVANSIIAVNCTRFKADKFDSDIDHTCDVEQTIMRHNGRTGDGHLHRGHKTPRITDG